MSIILKIIIKEFKQTLRQKEMRAIIFLMPIIQLFIFAYAVTTDIKGLKIGVADYDNTVQSRYLVDSFTASDYFKLVPLTLKRETMWDALISSKIDIGIEIPVDFADAILKGETAQLGLYIDGSNSSHAARGIGYAESVIQMYSAELLQQNLDRNSSFQHLIRQIELEYRYYYNPELESRFYMIPGIVVLLITVISAFLTGMAIVKEREMGTFEQLIVAPITPLQLIIGKTVPFAILAYIELAIATFIAVLWFNLPFTGSMLALAIGALLFLLVTLGIGILVSTVSNTQQQAMFTVWFFLVFGILMSGFFFPIDNMPEFIRILTLFNPLRYFMEIVRMVYLKGASLQDILSQLTALSVIGFTIFAFAVWRFKKLVKG